LFSGGQSSVNGIGKVKSPPLSFDRTDILYNQELSSLKKKREMSKQRFQQQEKEKEKISLEIFVLRGLLEQEGEDKHEDTILDIIAFPNLPLLTVHDTVVNLLGLVDKADQLIYYLEHGKGDPLDLDSTLEELKIHHGEKIIVDTQKRNRRKRLSEIQNPESDDEDNIDIVCFTRIFESEGTDVRRTRVLVKKYHPCSFLMDDISYLWNKNNLKFRCGRITLVPEKTFEELGITTDTEIIVTGARG
jgi:hypothetical protein